MEFEGLRLGALCDEPLADQRVLDREGLQPAERRVGAGEVGHVQVDDHELLGQRPQNVEDPPLLVENGVQVELADHLIDLLEPLRRYVLEAGVLAALAVDLEKHAFVLKVVLPNDLLKGRELLSQMVFGFGSEADFVNVVSSLV